ncbi:unnamed protein product [Durusdinium trenchii]|uniref:Uncharacterized protein n=2 Tax=Durusdinium trenchii TaxID=1381693 RepID=A0ABP0NGI5_9DINO
MWLLLLFSLGIRESWQKVWYPGVEDQIEGCYTVTADLTDDHSTASCGGKQCPNCYELDTSSSAITLTITNCHYVNGAALTGQAVFLYAFYNTGKGSAFVKDGSAAGAREYFIRPLGQGDAATTCMCKDGQLACSADTPEVLKVTASGSSEPSTECATLSGTSIALDLSTTACNSQYCPTCFNLDTTSGGADMAITLTNCNYYMGKDMASNYVIKYDFYNFGTYAASLTDGGGVTYQISYGEFGASATHCACLAGTSGALRNIHRVFCRKMRLEFCRNSTVWHV